MTVYTDENGTAWYVNLVDVTDLHGILAGTVNEWIETDMDPWERDGAADAMYYPLKADDRDQLEARRELLRDGTIACENRDVRVYGRRSGLHTEVESTAGEVPA